MINLVVLVIVILATLSGICGFIGVYVLTSLGWSLMFLSSYLFLLMCILSYLARNTRV